MIENADGALIFTTVRHLLHGAYDYANNILDIKLNQWIEIMKRGISYFPALLIALIVCLAGLTPAVAGTMHDLSPRQFKALIDHHRGDANFVLLDVRTPKEYAKGHIEGAILINYYDSDFVDRLKSLDRDKTYLVYCHSGSRSGRALAILEKMGFRHAYDMATGIVGWSRANYPLVRQPSS
jgi:rhodanese-related sulfurtransferase